MLIIINSNAISTYKRFLFLELQLFDFQVEASEEKLFLSGPYGLPTPDPKVLNNSQVLFCLDNLQLLNLAKH